MRMQSCYPGSLNTLHKMMLIILSLFLLGVKACPVSFKKSYNFTLHITYLIFFIIID